MKINHCRVLQAVADAGTFGGAALLLECTQSNVSYAIRELEQHVGFRLLTRSRAGCELTAEGREVLLRCARILEIADDLKSLGSAPSGIVRLVSLQSAGEALLARLLEECWARFPGIRIDVASDTESEDFIVQALRRNEADLAITQPFEDGQFVCQPLADDPYVLVLPASHGLRRVESFAQLAGLRFLQHEGAGARHVLQHLANHGFVPAVSFRATSVHAILSMVRRGQGFSVLPRMALPADDHAVLPLPVPLHRALVVAARPHSLRSRAAHAVAQVLHALRNSLAA
ncbi:LysR family transcriptional regulator [Ramlibacter albus]|uniref:LysR family transcriptional regulator n=1 Tax=Ramlibacter albus TaxID=2079448 RepID=A0A923MAK5_9BURK|nr:LysR family transcriptional regulator [Ramlibacter albus]MBC5766893.1 LysR family transcriptional regulator [Ramlibacter albus]